MRTSFRLFFNGNLQALNMGLFTLCSYLKTKESYDRWVTRRVWGFRHQISKAKNLKKFQSQISGSFRGILQPCKRAAKFHSIRTPFRSPRLISQPKADFAAVRNLPSTWSDWLPMAVTPSFQLQIAHRLKHWIVDFLIFENGI